MASESVARTRRYRNYGTFYGNNNNFKKALTIFDKIQQKSSDYI